MKKKINIPIIIYLENSKYNIDLLFNLKYLNIIHYKLIITVRIL